MIYFQIGVTIEYTYQNYVESFKFFLLQKIISEKQEQKELPK